jgi:peptide/nickel transport system substrate-binding protein
LRNLITGLALLAALTLSPAAWAQTLRWASQGDALTMDPHSQNEGLNNAINGQVYERLTKRDRNLALVPSLATEWRRPGRWLALQAAPGREVPRRHAADRRRRGVLGQPRQEPGVDLQRVCQRAGHAGGRGRADGGLPARQGQPDLPAAPGRDLDHEPAWAEKRTACNARWTSRTRKRASPSFNANGTGPYQLVQRQPGIKTSFKRNAMWWGRFDGNVQDIVFTPIANDATRLAALISGEIDFVLDPAPRDIARLRSVGGVKVIEGPENRLIFIGMDQQRDELLYGSVKDRNPFKDVRVRRALYQAIDIETMRSKLMNGLSRAHRGPHAVAARRLQRRRAGARLPFDLAGARRLMAEAGYADGFEVTIDCPNNRYVNDEEICIALATMWAQLKVKVKVNGMPRSPTSRRWRSGTPRCTCWAGAAQ